MSEVTNDMTVTEKDRNTVKAIAKKAGSRAGRTSKKMKSAAAMRARVLLKRRLREEITSKMTIIEFADQQDVRRQYMYKLLSENDNIGSLDQLMGYCEDVGLKLQITIKDPDGQETTL